MGVFLKEMRSVDIDEVANRLSPDFEEKLSRTYTYTCFFFQSLIRVLHDLPFTITKGTYTGSHAHWERKTHARAYEALTLTDTFAYTHTQKEREIYPKSCDSDGST